MLPHSREHLATVATSISPASRPANIPFGSAPQSGAGSLLQRQRQMEQHIEQPVVQDVPARSVLPSKTVPFPAGGPHAGSTTPQGRPQGAGQSSEVPCRGALQAHCAGPGGERLRALQEDEPLGKGELYLACSPDSGFGLEQSRQQQDGSRTGRLKAGSAVEAGGILLRAWPQDDAARKGVLQSGSSEDLAKALANLTQMVSCARSERGQHAAPSSACLPAADSRNQLLWIPASHDQETARGPACMGATMQHQPSLPNVVFHQQTAQSKQAAVGAPACGSMRLSLSHNPAAQSSNDTSGNHPDLPSSTAAQPASQADRQVHSWSCRVRPTPLLSSLPGAELQAAMPAEVAAVSQLRQADSEHGAKRKWSGLDASTGLQQSQDPGDAQADLQPAAKRGRPGQSALQMEHRQQLVPQLAQLACSQDAVQTSPQAAGGSAAGQDVQLDLQPEAGSKGLHAILRWEGSALAFLFPYLRYAAGSEI